MKQDAASNATLEELGLLFRVPGDPERVWLLDALIRIVQEVEWLRGYFCDDSLEERLRQIRKDVNARLPERHRDTVPEKMGGEFGLADAMIGTSADHQPRGLLTLRGLIWLAIRQRRATGSAYASSAAKVASALRSIATSVGTQAETALQSIIDRLGRADALPSAIEALERLDAKKHKTLRETWDRWLKPTLLQLQPLTASGPTQEPEPELTGKPEPDSPSNREQPARLERLAGIEVHRLRPRRGLPDRLPDEPADEFVPPTDLVLVRGFGTGLLSRQQADYRARQAIWGRNDFLLSCHIEALLPDVYGAALRALIAHLDESEDETGCIGWLGCLLKGISGRSTGALTSIKLGAPPDGKPLDALYLDVEAGAFVFPPYWKQPGNRRVSSGDAERDDELPSSYFRPSEAQKRWTNHVIDVVTLPLGGPIRRVLRKHRESLVRLSKVGARTLDRDMAVAADAASRLVGVPFTVAGLRRSLGSAIMEASGDLAMAQLVCGDSFGRPSAHQHYYAPRRKDVAGIYVRTMSQLLDGSASPRLVQAGERVGSELLVRPECAKQLASASHGCFDEQIAAATGTSRVVLQHRSLLDHLVRMTLATCGHRWSNALFTITLRDLDLHTGAVLFADKRHDVAHDPRLACLPSVVCRQIVAYVAAVEGLCRLFPEIEAALLPALQGSAPLLFDLREVADHLETCVPTVDLIHDRGPREWQVLPENWGRTYLRTRGLEMGAPAFLLACQLGHFDTVGYPFSNESPTEPIDVVLRLRPWLDRVAKTQGWVVLDTPAFSAEPGADDQGKPNIVAWPCMPLRDWVHELSEANERAAVVQREWQKSIRMDARKAREASEKAVLEHVLLVDAGVSAAYMDHDQASHVKEMDRLDLYRVRQELLADCGDDTGLALARVRALRHVLRIVAKLAGQPVPTVAIPIAVRRPLDNAFFKGACLALSQAELLRERVRERAAMKRPDRTFAIQVARVAEALALYGGIGDAATVLAIIAARANVRPSATIPDLALVPLEPGHVVALRGVASLALCDLAQRFPNGHVPAVADIETTLGSLLPQWAVGPATTGLLTRLCSTMAVANRFEYSPAARFAVDPKHGSMSATVEEQLAFIDGDPVGPRREASAEKDNVTAGSPAKIATARGSALSQYNMLCRMIPTAGQRFHLVLSKRTITAAAVQSDATRAAVIAELDLWLRQSDEGTGEGLWSIVRMLAGWTKLELTRRKPDGMYLKYRSIKTYLTRFGRALVQELGELDATRWTERVVEDAYEFALDASADAKAKVAAGLLSFHRFAEAEFDLPEVDLSPVYAELENAERCADAAMILPAERSAAFNSIAKLAWGGAIADAAQTRIARAADAVTPYLGYGGARLSEPMGMQVGDVARRPDGQLWARVRSNRLRSLKTRAAARVLLLGPRADIAHCERAWQWADAVRKNAGPQRTDGVYLVSSADSRNDLSGQRAVAALIRSELAVATGRQSERLHRLRHLVATERLTSVALSAQDAAWIGLDPSDSTARPLQPRDLHAVSVPLGHAHWRTTIQWYLHLPWVLQSRAAERMREECFERRTVAAALGVTPSTLDNLLRGASGRDRVNIWFDHFRPGRAVDAHAAVLNQPSENEVQWKWTAAAVGKVVSRAWRTKDLLAALALEGIPLGEAGRLELYAARWERKLGLRLLPEYIGQRRRECPGRAVRRLAVDSDVESLWTLLERVATEGLGPIRLVVNSCFEYLSPRSGEKMVLTNLAATTLKGLLEASFEMKFSMVCVNLPGGLVEVSVASLGSDAQPGRHRGLALKRVLAIAGITIALQSSPLVACRSN